MTAKQFLKDALVWGGALWLVGYVLGIVLFFVVPTSIIGWVLTPIGVGITLWVLIKKIHGPLYYFALVGVTWAAIAMALDYLLLVQVFKPADGYYKLDVYLYYALNIVLPLVVGLWKEYRAARNA